MIKNHLNPPLAELLRPKSLDDVLGQAHLLGPEKALRMVFLRGEPHSMILWGPPGVGKTTLAELSAQYFSCRFIPLSAVLSGVKEIRAAVDAARAAQAEGVRTLLFIDEIHRFNKSQQDALLPFTESGLITFIGATTENPSFEVNRALLSRAQVYVLKPLSGDDLMHLLKRAWEQHLALPPLAEEVALFVIRIADGDARRLLNLLELLSTAVLHAPETEVTLEWVESFLMSNGRRFDKGGDVFYDQISALHKSVRGSNPDAALYWFCRMLDAGVDMTYLSRRIVRMAWEDIGIADPRAIQIALDAQTTYDKLGSPEGELALAQAVIYLAVAAKSNAGYLAFKAAKAFVQQDQSREVPLHLRNAPTELMKKLEHGAAYRYAHDEPYAYAAGVSYWPEGLDVPQWYQPVARGLEIKIAEKLAFLKKLDTDALKNNQIQD